MSVRFCAGREGTQRGKGTVPAWKWPQGGHGELRLVRQGRPPGGGDSEVISWQMSGSHQMDALAGVPGK